MKLDLHFHSDASDGLRSHSKLGEILVKLNISYASLTDHDNMDNVLNLREDLKGYKTILFPGIELSTIHEGKNIHLLGYFNLANDSWTEDSFKRILESFRERRIKRAEEMVHRLKIYYGIEIDLKDINLKAGASLGRPHLANLISEKYNLPQNEVFRKYLNNDSKAYIPSSSMTYREGVDLLNDYGALALIAHPGEYKMDIKDLLIPGIRGIEAYYPTHSKDFTNSLIKLSKERNLFISCGTDDHGIPWDNKHGLIGSQPFKEEDLFPLIKYLLA